MLRARLRRVHVGLEQGDPNVAQALVNDLRRQLGLSEQSILGGLEALRDGLAMPDITSGSDRYESTTTKTSRSNASWLSHTAVSAPRWSWPARHTPASVEVQLAAGPETMDSDGSNTSPPSSPVGATVTTRRCPAGTVAA
jgi:hypothetical protein